MNRRSLLLALLLALLPLAASATLGHSEAGVVTHLPFGSPVPGGRPIILVYTGGGGINSFRVTIEPVLSVECRRGGIEAPKLPRLEVYLPALRMTLELPGLEERLRNVYISMVPGLPTLNARVVNESIDCNVSLQYRVEISVFPPQVVQSDRFTVSGSSTSIPPLLLLFTGGRLGSPPYYSIPANETLSVTVLALAVRDEPEPRLIVETPAGRSVEGLSLEPDYAAVLEAFSGWWGTVSDALSRLGVNPPRFYRDAIIAVGSVSGAAGSYALYYAEWRGYRSNPGIVYIYNPEYNGTVLIVDESLSAYTLLATNSWVTSATGESLSTLISEWFGVPRVLLSRLDSIVEALELLNQTGLLRLPGWTPLGLDHRVVVSEPTARLCEQLESINPGIVVLGFNPVPALDRVRCRDGRSLLDHLLDVVRGRGVLVLGGGSLSLYEQGVCDVETGEVAWLEWGALRPASLEKLGLPILALAERVKRLLASRLCEAAREALERGDSSRASELAGNASLVASAPLSLYTLRNTSITVGAATLRAPGYTSVGWELETGTSPLLRRDAYTTASHVASLLAGVVNRLAGTRLDPKLAGEAAEYSLEKLIPLLLEALSKASVQATSMGVVLRLGLGAEEIDVDATGLARDLLERQVVLLRASGDATTGVLCSTSARGYRVLVVTFPLSELRGATAWRSLLGLASRCSARYERLYGYPVPTSLAETIEKRLEYAYSYRVSDLILALIPRSGATLVTLNATNTSLLVLLHPGARTARVSSEESRITLLSQGEDYTIVGLGGGGSIRLAVRVEGARRTLVPLFALLLTPAPRETVTTTIILTSVETTTSTVTRTIVNIVTSTLTKTITRTTTVYKVLTPPVSYVTVTRAKVERVTETLVKSSTITLTITRVKTVKLQGGGVATPLALLLLMAGVVIGFLASRVMRWSR